MDELTRKRIEEENRKRIAEEEAILEARNKRMFDAYAQRKLRDEAIVGDSVSDGIEEESYEITKDSDGELEVKKI